MASSGDPDRPILISLLISEDSVDGAINVCGVIDVYFLSNPNTFISLVL